MGKARSGPAANSVRPRVDVFSFIFQAIARPLCDPVQLDEDSLASQRNGENKKCANKWHKKCAVASLGCPLEGSCFKNCVRNCGASGAGVGEVFGGVFSGVSCSVFRPVFRLVLVFRSCERVPRRNHALAEHRGSVPTIRRKRAVPGQPGFPSASWRRSFPGYSPRRVLKK